jgi:hypothetical protein
MPLGPLDILHGIVASGDQVRFIDNQEVAGTKHLRVAVNALHAADDDRRIHATRTERCAIDADWRLGPERQDSLGVLLDDLADMRENYDPPTVLAEPAAKLGNQVRFA